MPDGTWNVFYSEKAVVLKEYKEYRLKKDYFFEYLKTRI